MEYRLIARSLGPKQDEITLFMGSSRESVERASKYYFNTDSTRQYRVESNGLIVAIGLHNRLLWLDKVPPPQYWQKMPPRRLAACGLPIPARYQVTP
jgi:hypothetical protein